jgi:hypothetical protein
MAVPPLGDSSSDFQVQLVDWKARLAWLQNGRRAWSTQPCFGTWLIVGQANHRQQLPLV